MRTALIILTIILLYIEWKMVVSINVALNICSVICIPELLFLMWLTINYNKIKDKYEEF